MMGMESETRLDSLPPAGLEPRAPLPWESTGESLLPALFTTIWALLMAPGRSFQAMARQGLGAPLGFGLITGTFGLLAASYTQLLLSLSLGERLASIPGWSDFVFRGAQGMVVMMLLTPALVAASLFLGGLCLAAVLRLWGRAPSFSLALQVGCYAQAGLVLAILPLLGALVGASWSLYLRVRGVQEVFDLPGYRAWVAVLSAFFLEGLLLLIFLISLMIWLFLSRLP